MDEYEVVAQPTVANDTSFNNLLEITQQNALAIQILKNDMGIIKINTSRDDDIDGNE